MKYPHTLIPIPCWREMIDIDQLHGANVNFPVVRRISGNFEALLAEHPEWFVRLPNGNYSIAMDAELDDFRSDNLADLSMSIVSDINPIERCAFQHKMISKKDVWNGGVVRVWPYRKLCHHIDPCFFITFQSAKIHNIEFPYSRNYEKKSLLENEIEHIVAYNSSTDEEIHELVLDEISKTFKGHNFDKKYVYRLNGRVKLRHDPTPMNYWHIVLDILAPKKPALKSTKGSWRKLVGERVKEDILTKNCKINIVAGMPLTRDVYKKADSKGFCIWMYSAVMKLATPRVC